MGEPDRSMAVVATNGLNHDELLARTPLTPSPSGQLSLGQRPIAFHSSQILDPRDYPNERLRTRASPGRRYGADAVSG